MDYFQPSGVWSFCKILWLMHQHVDFVFRFFSTETAWLQACDGVLLIPRSSDCHIVLFLGQLVISLVVAVSSCFVSSKKVNWRSRSWIGEAESGAQQRMEPQTKDSAWLRKIIGRSWFARPSAYILVYTSGLRAWAPTGVEFSSIL